ncbi:MAG: cation diffusion facilitator family transporter [Desulfobacteraceae bacterium]|jgi:cation diffusion facilitator family transporter|nr:cation diffusion facilitator family transporter [Desulfobacteraceae bacterium]MDH3575662.1 cation diffusion facilitator family transporter [Desulfobacteraceae bacterium]MDH3722880.1 cation diffusion facilitator family transporter [Desulfobacteraceae bacterium]MDH3838330.1 cation diffusion facilitator family transporter [Desulfobacteraceae bacterium]MDH3875680.1 cation diffusion facilitator family transporter [Desulfobacteraceae bacterium]
MPESNSTLESTGRKVTLVGVLVNTFLILLKLVAGIFGSSQALIADAVHSFSDLFTDAVVLIGLKISNKPPDKTHHFGHARMETLASTIVGMALIGTALYIGIDASLTIYHHTEYHPTTLALFGAGVSIILKEVLYRYTIRTGRRIKSQLIVANAWHHRSDALSSVAVFIGVAGTQINPSWHILDAFAALLVSFFIVKVGLEILRDALREFTDTAPNPEIIGKIQQCALSVNGVVDTHDVRVRTSGGFYQMEIHIVVDGQMTVLEGHKIAKTVEGCLVEDVGNFSSITIHVDPENET